MQRMRLGIAVVFFAALVAAPNPAGAGLIDFIHEMSGPQMIGFPVDCEFDIQVQRHECRLVDVIHLSGDRGFRVERRLWLALTGAAYFSTGKDADLRQFKLGRVRMLAYEPTVNVRSFKSTGGSVVLEHGVLGLSYFYLMGSDFRRFDNLGVKLVPIAFTYKRATFAYTFRVFPNGFTSEQFGVTAPTPTLRESEVVNGLTFGLRF